jgi:hypothetical protein
MTFVINVTYDSSVTNLDNPDNAAYDPTLYTKCTSAVQTAVQYYENEFTSPITVNINFGWGEAAGYPIGAGAFGVSSTYSENYTYADVLAAVRGPKPAAARDVRIGLARWRSGRTGARTRSTDAGCRPAARHSMAGKTSDRHRGR